MKKILMTMAAVSALAIGAPASAQYARSNMQQYGGGNMQLRVQQLQVQLEAGVRNGTISRREARPLDDQIRQIDEYARINSRDGLSGRERIYLQQRISNLRQQIAYAEQTGNGRDERYGRANRYDDGRAYGANDGGYAREARIDSNGDGWDDRDLDRDGRIESDRDERNGDYLRVGQRISGNFEDMPSQYRDRYRDGSYYRYDGDNVYQVDARTNLILRIFAGGR